MEVSSKKNKNLAEVFSAAVEIVLGLRESHSSPESGNKDGENERKKNKKSTCLLL